jgi:hypothetical protein
VGTRRPVLGRAQRLSLEPPHLLGRGRLCIDGTPPHNMLHDGVEG